MKLSRGVSIKLGTLAAFLVLAILEVVLAWAQSSTAQSPDASAGAGEVSGAMIAMAAMVAFIAIIGVAVKTFDLKRKREEEAVGLQARITDALLMDPTLGQLPITATAHPALRRTSPVRIEVSGRVPTTALRDAAMALVMREALGSGVRFQVEDRIAVVQLMPRAA